ncbi:hypothetical protein [Streptomyces sp. H62]
MRDRWLTARAAVRAEPAISRSSGPGFGRLLRQIGAWFWWRRSTPRTAFESYAASWASALRAPKG